MRCESSWRDAGSEALPDLRFPLLRVDLLSVPFIHYVKSEVA